MWGRESGGNGGSVVSALYVLWWLVQSAFCAVASMGVFIGQIAFLVRTRFAVLAQGRFCWLTLSHVRSLDFSSAARRARIAAWNAERDAEQTGGGGDPPAAQ
jgi:hypothetical protein